MQIAEPHFLYKTAYQLATFFFFFPWHLAPYFINSVQDQNL